MRYKTLGELRADLACRLGFGAMGSAGINAALLDSFIQNAQAQLYVQFDWRHLIKYDEKTTGVSQTLYDWAGDCDAQRVRDVAVWDGMRWIAMREGIDWTARSTTARRAMPTRYECFAQMEIWPEPDAAYRIRRDYVAQPGRLTQDHDRVSLDDTLIFLHALTNAKLHYKQQDGQVYANQLNAMMEKRKGQHRGESVVRRGNQAVRTFKG